MECTSCAYGSLRKLGIPVEKHAGAKAYCRTMGHRDLHKEHFEASYIGGPYASRANFARAYSSGSDKRYYCSNNIATFVDWDAVAGGILEHVIITEGHAFRTDIPPTTPLPFLITHEVTEEEQCVDLLLSMSVTEVGSTTSRFDMGYSREPSKSMVDR